jgi:hypothetical protein
MQALKYSVTNGPVRGGAVENLGLAETVQALRAELNEAVAASRGSGVQFLVGTVQLEIHVAVTREAGASGKARFWVLEAGAEGKYSRESIQKVTVTLEPVSTDGEPISIERSSAERP